MKLNYLFCIVLAGSLQSVSAWAEHTPTMNEEYVVEDFGITGWNFSKIPEDCFLPSASKAIIRVYEAHYADLRCGDSPWNVGSIDKVEHTNTAFTYSYEITNIADAIANKYWINLGPEHGSLSITNCDASYVDPAPGGGEGGGSGTGGGDINPPGYEPDYSGQNDTDDNGVLEPDDTNPAFGAKVDYKKFPQLTDVPSMYITVYKTTATSDGQGGYTYTYDTNQTVDISTTKNDWYYQCRIVIADKYGNMKQRDELVGLRGRGNSTWTWVKSGKRPLRLKFPTKTKLLAEQDAQHNEINNFADAKSWTLMANAFDKTLIHNAFTYELGKGKLTNLPFCPAYRFVDLFVNGTYYGTYQVSDQVQVDKKRVNVNSQTGWFLEMTASKGGDFLEAPYVQVPNSSLYANVKNPEDAVEDTETYNAMKDYLTSLYNKIASSNSYYQDFSFKTGYRTLVDMPSLIDWFIGEEISANYDGTFGNIYTYREAENDKLHFGPMWDLDIAYGGHEGAAMKEIHIWDNSAHQWEGVSNMMRSLYTDPYFVRDLYERWQTIYNNGELKTFCSQKIEMLAALVSQTQAKNFTEARPFNGSTFGINQADNMGGSFASYDAAIAYFKQYVSARIDWLNSEYSTKYSTMGCATLNPCPEGHTPGYVLQDDGTYRRGCEVCGHLDDSDTQTYYEFTVYPESKKAETLIATSWHPSVDKPNAIAVVEAKQSVVEQIEGWNIVAGKKNAEGNLTCRDFRLTDGHPYYSENKFVATTATYSRSVSNSCGTMCLPFKQQNAVIVDNNGSKQATIYRLAHVDDEGMHITKIQPEVEGNASAYVPVFFMAESGVSSIKIDGSDITVKKSSAEKSMTSDDGNWTMTGSVEALSFADVNSADALQGLDLYYISEGKYWKAMGQFKCNPFRAYITTAKTTPMPLNAHIRIDSEDGIETIVNDVENAEASTVVSRLLLPLPAGQYQINGKNINIK